MTDDELDPSNDSSNDPAQENVRRLLAQARHDAPVPDDVAARLDSTLAGLVADRRHEGVVDLDAARRRRRRWTTGLVAAAAVVALGVSLPNLTGGASMDGDSQAGGAADSATSQDESSSRELAEDPSAESDASGAGEAAPSASPPSDATAPFSAPVELDPGRFKQDAQAARDALVAEQAELVARPAVCGDVPDDAQQVVLVRYDDQDGYLVFEPHAESEAGADDRQRVTLYLCPGGVPARQALVAGP